MNKENQDEKLKAFLRAHKPDVPRETQGLEERILNATVRRHWRNRLMRVFQSKPIYAWATACLAIMLVLNSYQSRQVSIEEDSRLERTEHTPTVAFVRTQEPEISDDEALLFLADSLDTLSSQPSSDPFVAFDAL